MDALPPVVAEKLDEVRALCRQYHVRKLSLFGSAAKGTFDPERSDLDFVVEFEDEPDPLVYGRRYLAFWKAVRQLYGRDVDLVTRSSVDNPYFLQVLDMTERLVYDAA